MNCPILYHGTSHLDFLQWLLKPEKKYIWFSIDEKQSEYHIFAGAVYYYVGKDRFPTLYRLTVSKTLKLLNLTIKDGEHYLVGDELVSLRKFLASYGMIPELEQLMEKGVCKNLLSECNAIIINLIDIMNQRFGLGLDGYSCFNDEAEISLIVNNISLFDSILFKTLHMKHMTNSLKENDPENFYYEDNDYGTLKGLSHTLDDMGSTFGPFVQYIDYMMDKCNDCNFDIVYTDYVQIVNTNLSIEDVGNLIVSLNNDMVVK